MRKVLLFVIFVFEIVQSQTQVEFPTLPYEYDALEPILSERLMKLHHQKHHRTYTEKTNGAFQQLFIDENETSRKFVNQSIETILMNLDEIPIKFRLIFRQNAGGFVNHKLFFSMLRPARDENEPEGKIRLSIEKTFGSWPNFRDLFTKNALNVFGSGWIWLYIDGQTNELVVNSTTNQDNPIMFDRKHRVVLALDLWEHGKNDVTKQKNQRILSRLAYYLVYENRRNEYVENFWRIVNWSFVEKMFLENSVEHFEL